LITSAIKQAGDQAKTILNSYSYSAESQLESVEVIDAVQGRESTVVKIRILTKAGVSAPIALPFNSNGLILNEVTNG
jgi:protein subunit release factor B